MGPVKWANFHLYLILSIFTRYAVGWMVAPRKTAELAKRLIANTCAKRGIVTGDQTIHADRSASMTAKAGGTVDGQSGRNLNPKPAHASDDNQYSESQFKTLKERPELS